jgi:hypothetical protein
MLRLIGALVHRIARFVHLAARSDPLSAVSERGVPR